MRIIFVKLSVSLLLLSIVFSCKKEKLVSCNLETIESLTIQYNNITITLNSKNDHSIIKRIYNSVYSIPIHTLPKSDELSLKNVNTGFIIIIKCTNELPDTIYASDNGDFLYKKQNNTGNFTGGPNNIVNSIIDEIIHSSNKHNNKNRPQKKQNADTLKDYPDISLNEDSTEQENFDEYDLECPDCDEPVYYLENLINDLYFWNNKNICILAYTRTENYLNETHEELKGTEQNVSILFTALKDNNKIDIYSDYTFTIENSNIWNNSLLDSLLNLCEALSEENINQKITKLERSPYFEKKIDVELFKDSIEYFTYRYNDGNTQIYLERIYNYSGTEREFEKLKCYQGYDNKLIVITSFSYSIPVPGWGLGIHTEDVYFITDKISLEP